MKILLINPPPFDHGENSRYLEKSPIQTYTMPLGLGYIASFLEREGYEVSLTDAYGKGYTHEKLGELIREKKPDVIGITCMSDQRASWFRMIPLIRSIDASIRIVLGGPHPSLMTEQVLLHLHPDAVVIGEGEVTMLELVKAWGESGDISAVHGIAYVKDGKVIQTPPRERIRDLDSIPFPAYHLVDLSDYGGWEMMNSLHGLFGFKAPPRYASISTSRGCINNCGYCSAPLIWHRRWTQRSAGNVVDEIEMLIRKYGVDFLLITDDIFTVNQKRVMAICEEILKRDLQIRWVCETAVTLVSPDLLHLAKKAGCCCIMFGVESGSPAVLSTIAKRIKEQDVVDAFRMTREAGILAGAFLIVGSPGENEKSINATIRLLKKITPDLVIPQIAMITPGTKFFTIAKAKGFLDDSFWITDLPFPYYTAERRLETLLRWHKKIFYYRENRSRIFLKTLRDALRLRREMRKQHFAEQ